MKKYELTSETKVVCGRTLHRIRALVAFGNVEAGELGGFIEKEGNLNQSGNAWVYGDARVYGNARVSGGAWVSGNARVFGGAEVYGNARVYGDAEVYGDARVCGNAEVYGDALVYGNAQVYGDAEVCGDAQVYGKGAIFWLGAIGSRNGPTTFFACKDKKIRVACGCFFGDLEQFAEKVRETHGDNSYAKVYMLSIDMAKERIDLSKLSEAPEE